MIDRSILKQDIHKMLYYYNFNLIMNRIDRMKVTVSNFIIFNVQRLLFHAFHAYRQKHL